MKEKVHNDSPNQIVNSIKTYLFLATFFLGALSLVSAQNSNANENATVYGGEITFIDGETYTSVCVGDGEADYVDVVLENASGRLKQWIITDEEGYILGLPDSPSDVNFDGAGVGICYIYHLSYNGMKPLVDPSGQGKFKLHIDEVTDKGNGKGRSHLSEPIMVERFQQPTAGTLEGGPFEFCVGDGEADNIADGAITLSGNMGTNAAWVVTDSDGNILGLPPSPYAVNFDEAPAGTCLVWHLSYENNVSLDITNASELTGCFALSNPITVNRYQQPVGGTLEGGPFEFCVGDGEADNIAEGAITLSGNSGTNSTWVVTDDQGKILGTPPSPYVVNFDEAPAGTCLIWYLSYEDNVDLSVENANDLTGCYALTNPIEVKRYAQPVGGSLEGGPFEFCVGDGEADNIAEGAITLSGNSGTNSTWVVTDDQGKILGTPPSPYVVNFDEAPAGTCLIWYLSYEDNVDLTVENANDLTGCYALTNPIEVKRYAQPVGGTLEGGPFEFCVGDGEADNIAEGAITLSGNSGTNSAWVVTDTDGKILGLPGTYSDANFDEAPAGTCLVWHLSYEDNVSFDGVENASDLTGCFALTNPIMVIRNKPNGGTLTGGTDNNFDFTVGDGTEDKIPAGAITLEGNVGTNSAWVVTNEDGTIILGLPANYADVNFDEAPAGICKVWHLSYEDGLTGTEAPPEGDHLVSSLSGCFSLSNAITVTRTAPSASKVGLFPNPAKGSVNVQFSGFSSNEINVSIYNLRNVQLSNKDYSSSSKRATLDISTYENGLYFMRVTDKQTGESTIKRLVVN
ncbi:T9SS type A sorting domain-containing protein [uncultured Algibacter sp.]|uniref:T9SS type A sorting domain-containing protein n=1 Tax=uncultured Algibacter sp. TaxID=298659 RepID=UPI00262EC6FD|nr:T9SS type A sorting domain-containing protein [uncultured Algibacter sp.]